MLRDLPKASENAVYPANQRLHDSTLEQYGIIRRQSEGKVFSQVGVSYFLNGKPLRGPQNRAV